MSVHLKFKSIVDIKVRKKNSDGLTSVFLVFQSMDCISFQHLIHLLWLPKMASKDHETRTSGNSGPVLAVSSEKTVFLGGHAGWTISLFALSSFFDLGSFSRDSDPLTSTCWPCPLVLCAPRCLRCVIASDPAQAGPIPQERPC